VSPIDPRLKRQILLFFAAILIPTAVLITFAMRLARQDAELSRRHVEDQRRDALGQLRRELAARLETAKLRELSRFSGESSPAGWTSPEPPVAFIAPLVENRLIPPWEKPGKTGANSPAIEQDQKEGEIWEFAENDLSRALASYLRAQTAAQHQSGRCSAKLSEARVLMKQDRKAEAAGIHRSMLDECDAAEDADGMPLSLYAAERLISTGRDSGAAQDYVIRHARSAQWLPPVQVYLMRSLLRDAATTDARQASEALSAEIHNEEQILQFSSDLNRLGRIDFPFHASPGQSVWLAYGDEPWLITVTSTASFAPPVVMAVSSKSISPPGATLLATKSARSEAVGEGFVDLQVEWPAGRFAPSAAVPPFFYAGVIALILCVMVFAGYLLLRDVSREIEVADMRSQFVASVSHELKTPLTAIRLFAETLAMGRADDARTRSEYLQTVVSESERLSRLVENVLDFSRIERGDKIYHMQYVSLPGVVRAAAQAMRYPLMQHGFLLNVSIEDDTPEVFADPDALQQAVLNLLANAMKYSGNARKIDLRLAHSSTEAVIQVADSGIGIAPADQVRIFEKFYRARSVQSERIAGTGLGLTLATHIVKAHGGTLQVSSEVGRGSTFSILLPLQCEAAGAAGANA
jgi:nitrogen-specific signal transduction histidine kinase